MRIDRFFSFDDVKDKKKKKLLRSDANHWCVTGYFKLSFPFHNCSLLKGNTHTKKNWLDEMHALAKTYKTKPFGNEPSFCVIFFCLGCGYTNLSFRIERGKKIPLKWPRYKKQRLVQKFAVNKYSLRQCLSVFIVLRIVWQPEFVYIFGE